MRFDRGTRALPFSGSPAAGSRAGRSLSRSRPRASVCLVFGRPVHDLPHRRHTLGADAKNLPISSGVGMGLLIMWARIDLL
jgi:hypothetical protein